VDAYAPCATDQVPPLPEPPVDASDEIAVEDEGEMDWIESAPLAGAGSDESKDRRSQAAKLIELAEGIELFHTPTNEPFATIEVGEHRETHAVHSSALASWLRRRYWDAFEEPVGGAPLKDAVETLAARAEFGGETHPVAVRVAALRAGCTSTLPTRAGKS
jgi:hypothetical protein